MIIKTEPALDSVMVSIHSMQVHIVQRVTLMRQVNAHFTVHQHCKCFDHKDYGDWKLQGTWRENLHCLWKRDVRIICRDSPQFLQPFSIDSADFPCRSPCNFQSLWSLWSKNLQCSLNQLSNMLRF